MKKLLKILLIAMGGLLVLMLTIPVLFKSRIEALVKDQVNQHVEATVDWSGFGLTLFRGFPDLSINLHDVSVVGQGDFEGDTLAALGRFELRANPFSAFRRQVEVHAILVDRPMVNGIVLEDGTANWDVASAGEAVEKPAPEEPPSGSSMGIQLDRFAMTGGRIFYQDRAAGMKASVEELNLELRGDFSAGQTDMEMELSAGGVDAESGGIRYLRGGTIGMDVMAAADLEKDLYTLKRNEIRLNGLILGAEGSVGVLEDGSLETDLRFFSRETGFGTLLSLVPAVYLHDFASVETRGTLSLEGSVKGILEDSLMPDAALRLEVRDGFFSYPDLPGQVSDVQLQLEVDFRGRELDSTSVDLERFHLLMAGNPFDLSLQVSTPVSDMQIRGTAAGMIDFSTLRDVVPLDDLRMEGILKTDLHVDTHLSYIEKEQYEKVGLNGRLSLEGMRVETPDLPVPVQIDFMDLDFSPRYVSLAGLEMGMGSSDLHLKGDLENFVPYVFAGKTVRGSLRLSSSLLDVNELMPPAERDDVPRGDGAGGEAPEAGTSPAADPAANPAANPAADPAADPAGHADTTAAAASFRIPENVDFDLTVEMDTILYEEMSLEEISGEMRISGGVAYLDGLSLEVIGGSVQTSGEVDTRGSYPAADLDLDISGVDIPTAYSTFVTVERLAPMARYCRGKASVEMSFRSLLDGSFTPLFGTVGGRGHVYTSGLEVHNTRSFVRLSELLKNETFRELAPNEVDLAFEVRDGRVIVDPFDIEIEDSKITVAGSHGIDMTLDYTLDMEIAKSDLGPGVGEVLGGITALAQGAGISVRESDAVAIRANITGTFGEPGVTTDLTGNLRSSGTGVGETVEQQVRERAEKEVEEVESRAREEASARAGELIRQAEEEGDRLVEEARKAGDELIREAEQQGENLLEEAGNNPLKKAAARRAAEELKRQAETRSEKLVREAEQKRDAIIAAAREQAAGIDRQDE